MQLRGLNGEPYTASMRLGAAKAQCRGSVR